MEYVIIGILIIIIAALSIKRRKDFLEEKHTRRTLENYIEQLNDDIALLQDKLQQETEAIEEAGIKYQKVIEEYNLKASQKREELENYYISLTQERQEKFDALWQEISQEHQRKVDELTSQYANIINNHQAAKTQLEDEFQSKKNLLDKKILDKINAYEAIVSSYKILEQEQQEKLFYTIQVPEEYKSDIDYLLNAVSPQVKHPDILSKLIWQEYVKPNLDETLKRVGIDSESGIYKITSLTDGKAYIGKSVNLKKRIQDHFKSVVGITSIADQAVHHQILKEGFWNWTIEKLCECDKEELSVKEKYYIELFKTQTWGFNKSAGG